MYNLIGILSFGLFLLGYSSITYESLHKTRELLSITDSIPTTIKNITICEGNTFVFSGNNLTSDTSICITTTNTEGKDSISCLNLKVVPTIQTREEIILCKGTALFIWALKIERDTNICRTFTSSQRCDSIHCIEVRTEVPLSFASQTICNGDSLEWRNQILTASGIYRDTSTSIDGCDSIFSLNLRVEANTPVEIQQLDDECKGYDIRLIAPGYDNYQWSTGAITEQITVNEPGGYALTVSNENGCQSIDELKLGPLGIREIFWQSTDLSCFDQVDGSFRIDSIQGGLAPYTLSLNGEPLTTTLARNNLPSGQYSVLVEEASGCREVFDFNLNAPEVPRIELEETMTVAIGDSILLRPSFNFTPTFISWSPSQFLSCDTCKSPMLNPFETTVYNLSAEDINGCSAEAYLFVTVDRSTQIFMPNTFSPNGDGINDELIPFVGSSISAIKVFQIFDRWGNLVFERKNISNGSKGWNGSFRGEPVEEGVYLYRLEIVRVDGVEETVVGDVMVVR